MQGICQPYAAPICGAQISTTANFIPSNSLVMGNGGCYGGSNQIYSAGVQSYPPIVSTGYQGAYSSRTLIPQNCRPVTPGIGMTPGLIGSGVYGNDCCGGCLGCGQMCGPTGCLGCLGCGTCCGPTFGCCGPSYGGSVGGIGGIGGGNCGGLSGMGCCGCGQTGCYGGQVGYGYGGCCPTCC